jgi:hypothetical protein
MRLLLGLTLLLASCNTAAVTAPIDLTISTEGGFTGRGVGSISIRDGAVDAGTLGTARCTGELTADERGALARALAAAHSDQWKRDYTPSSNPNGYADQVRYTLTLNGRTVSWTDESRDALPSDLIAIHDLAWSVRDRVARC